MTYPAHDLTLRELLLLRTVWVHGPASGADLRKPLEAAAEIDRTYYKSMYNRLDELVERGLVTKRESDGRTNEYAISHEGAELLWDVSAWLLEDR